MFSFNNAALPLPKCIIVKRRKNKKNEVMKVMNESEERDVYNGSWNFYFGK